jgi:hypothetical protein
MEITKASYGGTDCTNLIKSMVKENRLVIRASNNLIGDTNVGVVKYLEIEGMQDGEVFTESVREGSLLTLPKSKSNKLGIFYSNNNKMELWPCIYKSLDTIKKASHGKADIVTCMWNPMPDNPFHQVTSWYQSQSHLNQLLQILHCLYSAQEMNKYDYVSFLEHDVLYGEGYFDFPDFERGEVWTNMNYAGINREGWQHQGQRDEPFHEMTMRFDDAIAHCANILPNALRTNSGMIEPQAMKRRQWEAPNPSIHINHGHHFTSHYSIYRSDNTYLEHPYWGNHADYLPLFV